MSTMSPTRAEAGTLRFTSLSRKQPKAERGERDDAPAEAVSFRHLAGLAPFTPSASTREEIEDAAKDLGIDVEWNNEDEGGDEASDKTARARSGVNRMVASMRKARGLGPEGSRPALSPVDQMVAAMRKSRGLK
ncbi:hypothetical protein [Acidisoma cladoniae]|uniref:hypothetical protein n=1 Tax=Acidisoma cladoniae TaxID=3040935 RepID=UPI00254D8D77|nr:hypothetical protein [Acidisoma sp. PAMC 29798]